MQRRSLLPIALSALLAGVFSCSRDATSPPAMSELNQTSLSHRSGDDHTPNGGLAAWVKCDLHPAYVGSADIGPRGGRITAGMVTLVIPPGALRRTVHITATVPAGDAAYVEFQPSGLQFRKAAGLRVNTESCAMPYDPDILYVDDDGRVLERIDARYIPYLQLVAAPITHFSGYVLAW